MIKNVPVSRYRTTYICRLKLQIQVNRCNHSVSNGVPLSDWRADDTGMVRCLAGFCILKLFHSEKAFSNFGLSLIRFLHVPISPNESYRRLPSSRIKLHAFHRNWIHFTAKSIHNNLKVHIILITIDQKLRHLETLHYF